jgi:outer membrane protein assembly factor BamB
VPRIGYTYSFGTPYIWENKGRTELVVAGTQRMQGLDPATGEELWHVGGLTSFVCTTPTSDADTLYFAAWSTSDAAPDERGEATWGDTDFSTEEKADAKKILARLDKNGDGAISYEEMPVSRAKDAFRFLDRNGDGLASVSELAPLVEQPKGSGNNLMIAVTAGGKGDASKSHLKWKHRRGLPYVASPLLYDGRVYLAKAGGLVSCLDAQTGKTLFGPKRLDDHSEYYATPVGVDGHIVFTSAKGTLTVLRGGDEFEVVRTVRLEEEIHATPAIVDGTIYLRSNRALWAFGKK